MSGGGPIGGGGGVTPAQLAAAVASLQAEIAAASAWLLFAGDGSDGDLVVSGTTTMTGALEAENVEVQGAGRLYTATYALLVRDTFEMRSGGIFSTDLATTRDASGATGGTQITTRHYAAGCGGGAGSVGVGSNGTDQTGSQSICGGAGGNGGAGGVSAGGTASPTTSNFAAPTEWRADALMLSRLFGFRASTVRVWGGGAGGGGGGGAGGGQSGGGGGRGGPFLPLFAGVRILLDAGALVNAKGGNGGTAPGTNGGGGGAGGGGFVALCAPDIDGDAAAVNVTAGAVGAGNGTGANGAAGSAGAYIAFRGGA